MTPRIPVTNPLQGYLHYKDEILGAINRVLESGWYILGEEVDAFEREFAEYCGSASCVGVANGTDAIVLALKSLGVGPGDGVFTVSHTAVATVAAIELVGATPILVDIEPDTYTIDPRGLADSIEREVSSRRSVPKAVVAVHLYGQPCDLSALEEICEKFDLALIEDCAQAHGAIYDGAPVGTHGAAGTFSFYPTKNLAAFGDGGAVVFNKKALADACRALRQYGWHEKNLSDIQGGNSRLDEIHAAVLRVRLAHLAAEIENRRQIAALYDSELVDFVKTPAVRSGAKHAYHLYVIRTDDRDGLKEALAASGVGTGVHYPVPVHAQKAYAGRVALGVGGLPVTERYADEILSLPMHGFLTKSDANDVIVAIRDWSRRR